MEEKKLIEIGNKVAQFMRAKIAERMNDSMSLIERDINSGLTVFVREIIQAEEDDMSAHVKVNDKIEKELKESTLLGLERKVALKKEMIENNKTDLEMVNEEIKEGTLDA